MAPHIDLTQAASVLRGGGLVAYPTESVFGLGCDPHNEAAVARLVALKQRDAGQGLLLIGDAFERIAPYIDLARTPEPLLERIRAGWPGPQTWLLPASAACPAWIHGRHDTVGLRVTAVPCAAALCAAFGDALVSTSANPHGEPPARSAEGVRALFGDRVDLVLDGPTGDLAQPTPIRDALSGRTVRA
ncbi:Sua5/YciO/YrdC/YwlC family protein [Variovorax sp. LjRoot290]|uniref:L-threonylcarbamoyladenylate synthase n=1 Tax=Variovorax sp. LjRoot290 TaxID=3342316 RepID=UPI003ECDB27B